MKRISAKQALEKLIASIDWRLGVEQIDLLDSVNRTLAKDAVCDIDINRFDESARDGYGLNHNDVASASKDNPMRLRIIGTIGAGDCPEYEVEPGNAVKIMTGAALPKGIDSVVMFEDEIANELGESDGSCFVEISAPVVAGDYVNRAGKIHRAGDLILEAGSKITPFAIGELAESGNSVVCVYAKPKIGIISIGSELVDSSEVPGIGKKRDSNRKALAALCKDAGGDVKIYPLVKDDPDSMRAVYSEAIESCDIVVSTGGSCNGEFDFTEQVIGNMANVVFDNVAIRPGKSQVFAIAEKDNKKTLIFGLSGAPGAAIIGFVMYVATAIKVLQGNRDCIDSRIANAISEHDKSDPDGMLVISRRIFD